MKFSRPNQSVWKYVFLGLMLLALAGFSLFPVIDSILEQTRFLKTNSISGAKSENNVKLETEAFGYQLVLEREPENQTALKGLLQVRLEQQDLKGAIEPLEKLATLNSDAIEYSLLLAQAKQQVKDFEGAMAVYREFLASHPANIEVLQGMVNLLLQRDGAQTAIELLQNTLANAKSDRVDINSVELLLARVYVEQKNYPEAIALYDRQIERDEKDFRPVLSKALVLQEQQNSEAKIFFDRAIELAPAELKNRIETMAARN